LVLVGHGPVIESLAALGGVAGFAVSTLSEDAETAQLAQMGLDGRASVVVASHADTDEDALARVLDTDAGYISLVASRRRAAAIFERVKQRGTPPDRSGRLKAPAGLDIGAITPDEIAVSILAEIIQHRRSEKALGAQTEPAPAASVRIESKDPICGMMVDGA